VITLVLTGVDEKSIASIKRFTSAQRMLKGKSNTDRKAFINYLFS
jgi:hypothetical protein